MLLAALHGLVVAIQATDQLPAPVSHTVDFLKEVRPLLEANCFRCHGPEKQKSSFRLDAKADALQGGERGVAIIPGRSADSPLIQFVAGQVPDMQMPPATGGTKRLSIEQIGVLRAWIDQGAQWPEEASSAAKSKLEFWTFQPAHRPVLPEPKGTGWVRNPIDGFILTMLEPQGLSPSPEADRRTLMRRVSFDLIGLPPTPEALQRFVADSRPDAYERLVDDLLSSPRYGERWARHWLDVVHYGETHGYDKDKTRPNAWPYRDYVIRAFNEDKPYSRFVQEQLAGDALFPNDPQGVVALGFLAAGPWDFVGHVELAETKTDGLIARYNDRDDMVMTTMATFQSLTVHCARCHDHKFDPIAQEDYYRLQAVFAGVDRAERPYDSDPVLFQTRQRLLAQKKSLESLRQRLDAKITAASPKVLGLVESRRHELVKQIQALPTAAAGESPSNGFHSEIANGPEAVKWVQVDLGKAVPIQEIRLIPARPTDFADTPGFGFPPRFRVETADGPELTNPTAVLDSTKADYANPGDQPVIVSGQGRSARLIRVTATRLWERSADYVFALGELQALSGGKNVALGGTVTALDSIESGRWAKRYLVDGFGSRTRLDAAEAQSVSAPSKERLSLEAELHQLELEREKLVEMLLDDATKAQRAECEGQLAEVTKQIAQLPVPSKVFAAAHEFAATGNFKPAVQPRPVSVLRRGEVKQPIHLAEPGALGCLPALKATFALRDSQDEGSRRAALAQWITAPANLLTRRSIVNRVWQNHFGRGIVDTANDFGHMGSLPSHPELLDWLAYWFLDHGESLKSLHRLIVTSATYRQSSQERPEAAKLDADNRYLWRMNRARLDAECLRDSILAVAGRLDLTMGGPSVQQFFFKDDHSPVYDYTRFDINSPAATRRSVYRFIVRSVPDPFMEAMDCPDASLLTPKRNTTMTALQALALLNDPWVLRQAEVLAGRLEASQPTVRARVDAALQLALGRPAREEEGVKLTAYAQAHGLPNFCRLLFNLSEFMFVD